jgi:radical SAM-linked protein
MAAAVPAAPPPTAAAGPRARLAVRYGIDGDQRFLSHHDELRALSRALLRARWPVAYSQGFNPQPRVLIVLPRPVGTASDCQVAFVTVRQQPDQPPSPEALAAALPSGWRLQDVAVPTLPGVPQPRRARFAVALTPADAAALPERCTALLAAATLPITRTTARGQPLGTLDVRPFVEALELDGLRLMLVLRYEGQRSARPSELLTALELDAARYRHHVRLIAVEWNQAWEGPTVRPPTDKGQDLGQESKEDDDAFPHAQDRG